MILQSLIIFSLLSGSLGLLQAPLRGPSNNVLNDETDAFINQIIADRKSPGGVSITVVRKDNNGAWNVETRGYGIATAKGKKVTENTLFSIGSNSKVRAYNLG